MVWIKQQCHRIARFCIAIFCVQIVWIITLHGRQRRRNIRQHNSSLLRLWRRCFRRSQPKRQRFHQRPPHQTKRVSSYKKVFASVFKQSPRISSLGSCFRRERLSAEQCFKHVWLDLASHCNTVILCTDKLKKFIIRRKWQVSSNLLSSLDVFCCFLVCCKFTSGFVCKIHQVSPT